MKSLFFSYTPVVKRFSVLFFCSNQATILTGQPAESELIVGQLKIGLTSRGFLMLMSFERTLSISEGKVTSFISFSGAVFVLVPLPD